MIELNVRRNFLRLIAPLALAMLGACGTTALAPPQGGMKNAMNFKMGEPTQDLEPRIIIVTMRNSDHKTLVGNGQVGGPTGKIAPRWGRLLTDWREQFGIKRVADWPLSTLGVRCLVFQVPAGRSTQSVVAELSNEHMVETVQELQSFRTLAGDYNDPYKKMQHGLKQMDVTKSHRWATGKGVKVAIVDTGLDSTHSELADAVAVKKNMVDGNPRDFDEDVHGTAVAGIIAAKANNGKGIVGLAPDAKIMGMKACWQKRPGYDGAVCNTFTLAKAINASIQGKADIINLSLAGPNDPLLERLVKRALQDNIVVVGAVDPSRPDSFPASTSGVLAVDQPRRRLRDASANNADNANSANTAANGGIKTFVAPGRRIVSARPGNQYDMFNGSSLSAAHVSGLAALIRQRKPHISGQEVADILQASADDVTGIASACRALSQLALVAPEQCDDRN